MENIEYYRSEYMELISKHNADCTAEEWADAEFRKSIYIKAAEEFIGKFGIEAWEKLGYCR